MKNSFPGLTFRRPPSPVALHVHEMVIVGFLSACLLCGICLNVTPVKCRSGISVPGLAHVHVSGDRLGDSILYEVIIESCRDGGAQRRLLSLHIVTEHPVYRFAFSLADSYENKLSVYS
jgi:hypothetical protein